MIRIADAEFELAVNPAEIQAVELSIPTWRVIVFVKGHTDGRKFAYASLAEARAAYKNFVSDLNHMLK